jgi:hypothetical protein
MPEGHSHLVSLYRFRGSFKPSTLAAIHHRLPKTATANISWWQDKLSSPFLSMNIICPPNPLPLRLYIDTSMGWGIGLILNDKCLAWELKTGWKANGHDIGWAEMVTIKLAIHTLVMANHLQCHITIHSDNASIVGGHPCIWSILWHIAECHPKGNH